MYKLLPSKDEKLLFFRLDSEATVRHGAIGYLRADFGGDGRGFWTAWFDSQPHLKTPGFKTEFDTVINSLRDDGLEPPFASRGSLEAFCTAKPGKIMTTRGSGYMARTQDYSYYFRCRPSPFDYDIFCFVYDNRWLLPELAGQHELPDVCYSMEPSTGDVILLKRNERGYYPCEYSTGDPEYNRAFATDRNIKLGVTRAQEEAMAAGSLFGWSTPAAKPWNYDQNGTPRPLPPREPSRERG